MAHAFNFSVWEAETVEPKTIAQKQKTQTITVPQQIKNKTTAQVFKRPKSKTLTTPNAGAEAVEKQKL